MDVQQSQPENKGKGPIFFDQEGFREEAFSDEGKSGRVPDHHGHVLAAREEAKQSTWDGVRQWMDRREPVDLEKPVCGLNFMDLLIGKDEKTGEDRGFWSLTGIKGSFFYGQEKMRQSLQALAALAEARRLKEGEGRILGVGKDFYGDDGAKSTADMSGADFYAQAKARRSGKPDIDIRIDPSHQVEGPGERKLLRAPVDGEIIIPNAVRLAAEKGPESFEKRVPPARWVAGPVDGKKKEGPDQLAGAAPVSHQIAPPSAQDENTKDASKQAGSDAGMKDITPKEGEPMTAGEAGKAGAAQNRNARDMIAKKSQEERAADATATRAVREGNAKEAQGVRAENAKKGREVRGDFSERDEKKILDEISSGATAREAAPGVDGARAVPAKKAEKLKKPSAQDVSEAEGRSRARRGALRAQSRAAGAERPQNLSDAVANGRQTMRVVSVDDSGNVMLEGKAVEVATKTKKKIVKKQDER